jgi:hypothetical protein
LVDAIDIDTLLHNSGFDRISILKVDIEGAEVEVFSKDCQKWIDKVDSIVIELHDDECRRVFHEAVAGANFEISEFDELTVCRRPSVLL